MKKKRSLKPYYWGFGIVSAVLIFWVATQPNLKTGTVLYGICRTYIELNMPYPYKVAFVDLRERRMDVRVSYIFTDPQGQKLLNEGYCRFRQDDDGKTFLASFRLTQGLEGRDFLYDIEDPKKIDLFNKSKSPAIIAANPPQLYVYGLPRRIGQFRTNYQRIN